MYEQLRHVPAPIYERFAEGYLSDGLSGARGEEELRNLVASTVIGIWLVARLYHSRPLSFAEAEQWFLGDERLELAITRHGWPDPTIAGHLEGPFAGGDDPRELLPYIMEVFHTGPVGTSRTAHRHRRNDRKAKRREGIFYTPADVARYITAEALREHVHAERLSSGALPGVFDPACGTGAFLSAAYDLLRERLRPPSWHDAMHVAGCSLYGADISEIATNAAALVLVERLTRDPRRPDDPSPWLLWQALRSNLAVLDSTSLIETTRPPGSPLDLFADDSATRLPDVFPRSAGGFDVLVGNPPYAYTTNDGKTNVAFVRFVEMMWRLTREGGTAGMVLPLSVSYSSSRQIAELRRRMNEADGSWRFAFFDRTPDSLFGDDVKTRNAIAFFRHSDSGGEFETTHLMRWSSRSRPGLFDSIHFISAPMELARTIIPRLGTAADVAAYTRLRLHGVGGLGNSLKPGAGTLKPDDPRLLHLGTTAYNWLPVYRERQLDGAEVSRSGLWTLSCPSADQADMVFAVLSSGLLYWLWRVEGDGFHLPKRFIMNAPISVSSFAGRDQGGLARLGRELWRELVNNPVRSTNSGKLSVSFSPHFGRAPEIVGAIDDLLEAVLDLPRGFAQYLRDYVRDTVIAGRVKERNGEPT